MNCENRKCLKRHPKTCKYFERYNRCKFGVYCAFAHTENPLVTEMKKLKIKYYTLEEDLNTKRNEVFDLKVKVEALEKVVEDVVQRVENNTTPTRDGLYQVLSNYTIPILYWRKNRQNYNIRYTNTIPHRKS